MNNSSTIVLVKIENESDECIRVVLSSQERVKYGELKSFTHDLIISKISDFVGKFGLKKIKLKFIDSEKVDHIIESTHNWTSESQLSTDFDSQFYI